MPLTPFRLFLYASYAALVLPLWAAWHRRTDREAHWWIAVGCFLAFASNVTMSLLGSMGVNNHFVWNWFAIPVTACWLLGIAEFLHGPVERLATRLAVPLFAVAWVVVALWIETGTTFTPFLGPLHSLTVLGAATWALVRLTLEETDEPVTSRDWFWILGGLAWYGALTAPTEPLALVLLDDHPEVVTRIWRFRTFVLPASWLLVTWGILCHRPLKSSGSSSPPAPSR